MGKTLIRCRDFVRNPSTSFSVLVSLGGVIFVFASLGVIFIPYAGIQNDEALFANPIYQHNFEFAVRNFHHTVPLMLMSYLGTLKTLMYWPLLRFFPANAYSVRLPMVLAGCITIFIFFLLAGRVAGRQAAWIATILLASDPIFLLTDTFDWGPVAIDHVLVVTGTWALVKYHQDEAKQPVWLGLGFLLFGLALWNKALFLWTMAGMLVGVAAIFPKEILRSLTPRRVGIAVAAFVFGSNPFILYNIRNQNATLSTSAKLEIQNWTPKLIQVRDALNGGSLNGYIVAEERHDYAKQPVSLAAKAALAIRTLVGARPESIGDWAALVCLLMVPLWWRFRSARFALIFLIVSWLMMALTKDAGLSAHHVVLLWPYPQLFIGVTLAAIPWSKLVGLAATALVLSNLLVINQYLLQMERDGPGAYFTDAIYRLRDALRGYGPETVYVTDWGMQNSLALLSRGTLKLETAEGDFNRDDIGQDERNHIAKMTMDREAIFIGHAAGQEIFTGSRARVAQAAENAGQKIQVLQTIQDSHGRPMFEIFRLGPG